MGQNVELLAPALGFNVRGRALEGELSDVNWPFICTPAIPSERKRVLEVIRRVLKRVVRREFVNHVVNAEPWRMARLRLRRVDAIDAHDLRGLTELAPIIALTAFGYQRELRLSDSNSLLARATGEIFKKFQISSRPLDESEDICHVGTIPAGLRALHVAPHATNQAPTS